MNFDKACRARRAELTGAGVNEHAETKAQRSKNLCSGLLVFSSICSVTVLSIYSFPEKFCPHSSVQEWDKTFLEIYNSD